MSLIKWRQRAPAETPSMSEREGSACVVFLKAKKKYIYLYRDNNNNDNDLIH